VKQGKRSGRDAELVWGKQRRLAGVSIKLHLSMGGGDDGAVALQLGGWRRLRRPREGDEGGVGRAGPEWPGGLNATWAGAERK
jgi:hypothetical protein